MRKPITQLIFKTLNIVLLAFFLSLVQFSLHANNLKQEIEVIEKLYKDGVLTKEEFEKTKKILIFLCYILTKRFQIFREKS